MNFYGEITFDISDDNCIEIDLGADILPTRIVNKGDLIVLGRKAPKYRWIHKERYADEKEYISVLDNLLDKLCNRREYIRKLAKTYEEVCISVYIRSDFAQIGYSLPSYILKKISLLDCTLVFEILSFGGVLDK